MKPRIHLLVIDPQNDFCDLPEAWRPLDPISGKPLSPALPVPGAHADLQRVADLIRKAGAGLADITITLDSHHRVDIAHPPFWMLADGAAVAPFTPITAAQVRAGAYRPRDATALPRTLAYLDELEARGRYTLMVWPVHCEIGSWGHAVHAGLHDAYADWEVMHLSNVAKVTKGENPWTEHYSALLAEVPDTDDERTQLNTDLLQRLVGADRILVAGEAGSHCVKATITDLAEQLGPECPRRITLLTDAVSPVTGFEAQQRAFLAAMQSRGATLATTAEVLPQLQAAAR
jgi:nicotinamidase-related amidase